MDFVKSATTESVGKWLDRPLIGALCMALSVSLYPITDACLKHFVSVYSVEQTAFLRALMRALALCVPLLFLPSPLQALKTKEKTLHFKRLIVSIGSTYCFLYACSQCSLTLLYTLGYTTPFFMILLSAWSLREKVPMDRWLAVLIGMGGVLVALHPTMLQGEVPLTAALLILLGTLCNALNKTYMRTLAKTEESVSIALYPNIAMLLLSLPFVCTSWKPMSMRDWMVFGGFGLAMGLAQFLAAFSLRCAESSFLASLDYSTFVWVVLIDNLIWDKTPTSWTFVGAIFIILSNLWIISRSASCRKKPTLL